MNRGVGNISRSNKIEPSAAPTVTAANSGVSLLGTTVQLGGAASPLLHNTVVKMGTFDFIMQDAAGFIFLSMIDASRTAILGDQISGRAGVKANMIAGTTVVGDISGSGSSTALNIDDTAQRILFVSGGFRFLDLNIAANTYHIGDIQNFSGGNSFLIDGTLPRFVMQQTPAAIFFDFNVATSQFLLGDLSGIGGLTNIALSDGVGQAQISSRGFSMLSLDVLNKIYQIGSSSQPSDSYFQVDGATSQFTTVSNPSVNGLLVDNGGFNYNLGDYASISNSNYFNVNDSANQFRMLRAGGTVWFDMSAGNLTISAANGTLIQTSSTLTNAAGASIGTLTNAPSPGNPTKWIQINDNGTIRKIPSWL